MRIGHLRCIIIKVSRALPHSVGSICFWTLGHGWRASRPIQAVLGLLVLLVGLFIQEALFVSLKLRLVELYKLFISLTIWVFKAIWPHDIAKAVPTLVIHELVPRTITSFLLLVSMLAVTTALIAIVITWSILPSSVLALTEVDLDVLRPYKLIKWFMLTSVRAALALVLSLIRCALFSLWLARCT